MSNYAAPESDLGNIMERKYQPVRAIFYGVLVAIFLSGLASIIISVVFGFMIGVDFEDQAAFEAAMSSSAIFMFVELLLTLPIFYYGGKVVGKRTPGKELLFGVFLIAIILTYYVVSGLLLETFGVYPAWYTAISFIAMILTVFAGAKSTIKI